MNTQQMEKQGLKALILKSPLSCRVFSFHFDSLFVPKRQTGLSKVVFPKMPGETYLLAWKSWSWLLP